MSKRIALVVVVVIAGLWLGVPPALAHGSCTVQGDKPFLYGGGAASTAEISCTITHESVYILGNLEFRLKGTTAWTSAQEIAKSCPNTSSCGVFLDGSFVTPGCHYEWRVHAEGHAFGSALGNHNFDTDNSRILRATC